MDRRQPERVVGREAEDPLHPEAVRGHPGAGRAARVAAHERGHRVGERPRGRRVDADLRRQLGRPSEPPEGQGGQLEPRVQRGHRGRHVGARQVAQRRRGRHRPSLGSRGHHRRARSSLGLRREHRPEPGEPQAGAGRDRPVRPALDDREGPAAGRRLSAHRRQRAPARGHLGGSAARDGCHDPAAGPAPRPRPPDHRGGPRLRHARRVGPREGPRRRRGGDIRRPGREPGHRGDRRRRARARGDLEAARRGGQRAFRADAPGGRRGGGDRVRAPRDRRRTSRGAGHDRAAASGGTGARGRGPCARSSSGSPTAWCPTCRS